MASKLLIMICVFLIFSSLIFAANPSSNPTTWWDSFVDDFFNIFGVEPELSFDLKKHNPLGDKQEYIFKTSINNQNKYFDYEVKVLSKKANIETWLEYYEERICEEEVFDYLDLKKGKNGTIIFKTEYYDCSTWIIVTKKEARKKLMDDNDLSRIVVRRKWGVCPEENRVYMPEGMQPAWTCEQRVDIIVDYAGRKYIEFAQWLQNSGSWSGMFNGTKESGGNIVLAEYDDIFELNKDNNNGWVFFHCNDTVTDVINSGNMPSAYFINGTKAGVNDPNLTTGTIGSGFSFDGIDDVITVGNIPNNFDHDGFRTANAVIAFHFRPIGDGTTNQYILDMSGKIQMTLNSTSCGNDGILWSVSSNAATYVSKCLYVNGTLNSGDWNAFVWTADASGNDLYINGVKFYTDTNANDIGSAADPFTIGSARGGASFAKFDMDMPYIGNETWTQADVDLFGNRSSGSFLSNGIGDGSESNWNILEYYNQSGDVNITVRSSADNSSWSAWVEKQANVDLDINGTKYIQWNASWLSTAPELEYVNITAIVPNAPPTTPTGLKPTNNSVFAGNSVVFNWTNSTDIEGADITYNLQISQDNKDFTSLIYFNNSINETATPTGDNVTLGTGDYYWRVLAYDKANSTWANTQFIDFTQIDAPTTPDIYPTGTYHNYSFNGICENSTGLGTINYEFYFGSNNPPTTLVQNTTATTFANDYVNGTYYFRCRANNEQYNSRYTSVTIVNLDNTAIWNSTVEIETTVI